MRVGMSQKASWQLSAGDEIAQGRSVVRLLGGGSRYEAYLVWDARLFAPMVAKLIRPDQARDDAALRALRREAEALDALAHPVIRRGFDAVLEPPHPHLLLEHLEGPSLRELVRRDGPLAAEQVVSLGRDLASALHYMAAEGWLHLDLKPDNVVMGAPPRVIDLSLARTLERAARIRVPVGTNAYMAPEQCVPSGDLGPPTDVWGLGATLFVALAGRRPFSKPPSISDADPESRFPQLDEAPQPLAPSAPAELSAAVLSCLRSDPAARPSAAELARALERPARARQPAP